MKTFPGNVIITNRPDPQNSLRLDHGILPYIVAMETGGIRVDRKHLVNLHSTLTEEMRKLEAAVNAETKYPINLASGDQLADLLFVRLGLKQGGKEKWTKSRARLAADSDVLRSMITQHSCIRTILKYKEMDKLRNAFTLSLIAQADSDDKIHCDFNHTATETGRLSSSQPNLQQIPGRTKLGKEVRRAFIADRGQVLGVIDASQIEARMVAEDAKCLSMIQVFREDKDLYWSVAEQIFRRVFSKEDRESGIEPASGLSMKDYYRQAAKTTTLGVLYAIEPAGLADLFLTSDPPSIEFLTGGGKEWEYSRHYDGAVKRCTDTIRDFFQAFVEILNRRREHHRRAKKYGFAWDMFGRVRWIPQVYSTHPWIVSEGLRAAGNLPGQGGAAGIMKLWMRVTYDRIQGYWGKFGVRPLIVVHDEMVFSGPKECMVDFIWETEDLLKYLLPRELFSCPLEAKGNVGDRYGDIK